MTPLRDIDHQHHVGAALGCPRCGATQLLRYDQRFWHCDICRTLLLRTRSIRSPFLYCFTRPRRSLILTFDNWLRAELALVMVALIGIGITGAAPLIPVIATVSVCAMLEAVTYIAEAAAGLRGWVLLRKIDPGVQLRSLGKVVFILLGGIWILCSGVFLFHLSILLMTNPLQVLEPILRRADAQRQAQSLSQPTHDRKLLP